MKESNTLINESLAVSLVESVSCIIADDRREKIEHLEAEMLTHPQLEIPVEYSFAGGMYARKILIPAGTLLTGRIHKFDHFEVMISGDITVSTDSGKVERLVGGHSFSCKAGKKRAGFAHTDTVWVSFHSAEPIDPDIMYDYITCGTFDEYEEFKKIYAESVSKFHDSEKILTEIACKEIGGGS